MTDKKEHSIEEIKSVSAEEFIKLRLLDVARINYAYVILGFIEEFWGGYEPSTLGVERIAEQEPAKKAIFKNLCIKYLHTINEEFDVEVNNFGVSSEKVSDRLKQFYSKKIEGTRMFAISEEDDLFKKSNSKDHSINEMFNHNQYSYILGVILRHRVKDTNRIAFAGPDSHKAKRVLSFLRNFYAFGDKKMTVEYTLQHVPGSTSIYLSLDNQIWGVVEGFVDENNLLEN